MPLHGASPPNVSCRQLSRSVPLMLLREQSGASVSFDPQQDAPV